MAELIGHGRCPIGCGSTKARFSLSSSKLTVGTCNACNTQVFARSDRSDELLRANIIPATAPDDALLADSPAAPPPADPVPAAPPPPSPAPVEPPRKKPVAWGMLRGLES